jgi:hypothetical protein
MRFMPSNFLTQNLAALRPCPQHTALVEALMAYDNELPEGFVMPPEAQVFETEAGDLTLHWKHTALHANTGALSEAQDLVADRLLAPQHAINLVIGIGLGHVLQEALAQMQEQTINNNLFLFEPNLPLLHFAFSNINLANCLTYEKLTVSHKPEKLYNFAETHLVQGDGISFLMTDGYLAAFSNLLEPIITKLEKHTDNAMKNSELLSLRGRAWTEQFIENTPYLVNTLPIVGLQNRFKGKTTILCGAGPSLTDSIETIKANRDKVLVMAVSGAVRPLVKNGITPDFIYFMDYIGPTKHLRGIEDQLTSCHFITGPSAEKLLFDLPHQSTWVASLHFNEQFSYLLDEMYSVPLPRYLTGGTVSIFMFHIAFDLGCRNFILAGQDMALRGSQVYADGQEALIIDGTVQMPEGTDTFERCMELQTVYGWNKEPLQTQADYAHFLQHYLKIAPLMEKEAPEARLFNASVGGAYIEGWQHDTIANIIDLLNADNQLAEPIAVEAIMAKTIADCQSLDLAAFQQRMLTNLSGILADLHKLVTLGQSTLDALAELKALKASAWAEASERYSQRFNTFSEMLETHPLLRDTLYGEQLEIYQTYNHNAQSEAEHRQNMKLDEDYFSTMLTILRTQLRPRLQQAIDALTQQQQARPPIQQSITINGVVAPSQQPSVTAPTHA